MLLYRLLYIVRETWGECKNPLGWGRGGGVLWGVWFDYQISSGEPKVYIFVCCLVRIRSHFHSWIDYNGVAHLRVLGVRQFFTFTVSNSI